MKYVARTGHIVTRTGCIDHVDSIEQNARDAIVNLAKAHGLYFECWSGHFGRYFLAHKNTSGKEPDIYATIFESHNDLVGDDAEVFRFNIPKDGTRWQDLLAAVKAHLPTNVKSN